MGLLFFMLIKGNLSDEAVESPSDVTINGAPKKENFICIELHPTSE